jgi:sialate O-acetylesterase
MKLNAIFSDNMVLQAQKTVYFFGEGQGTATVEIGDKKATVTSNKDAWRLSLPAFEYGGPYEVTITLNGQVTTLHDVYFGDVYLLSGQSNNQFKLWQSNTPKEYYEDNDSLRLFTVDRLEDQGKHVLTEEGWKSIDKNGNVVTLQGEHYESKDGWIKARTDNVGFWTAIGYLIGHELTRDTGRKIGIIACYQGASVIQSWLPEHYLDETEFFIPWELRSAGARNPDFALWNSNGKLYSGMIEPILPFAMKSVIWYQGEANTCLPESKTYIRTLAELIRLFRSQLRDPQLPFYVIQLADYDPRNDEGWRTVQAAQLQISQELPYVSTVICADVCESNTIHPPTKQPLAHRLAKRLLKEIS